MEDVKMKWEYKIERFPMPSDWQSIRDTWEHLQLKHLEKMNSLGADGWEYIMTIGPLLYFKRPILDKIPKEAYKRVYDD